MKRIAWLTVVCILAALGLSIALPSKPATDVKIYSQQEITQKISRMRGPAFLVLRKDGQRKVYLGDRIKNGPSPLWVRKSSQDEREQVELEKLFEQGLVEVVELDDPGYWSHVSQVKEAWEKGHGVVRR